MPEKIKRVRRKRRSRSLPGIESFSNFRFHLPPVRVALYVAAAVVAVFVVFVFGTYGSKIFAAWPQAPFLHHPTPKLEEKKFFVPDRIARRGLERYPHFLPAF